MKKFNKGDVYLYSPITRSLEQSEKTLLHEAGLQSARPVIIYREFDNCSPYGDILVVPATTRKVPIIEFKVDRNSDFSTPVLRVKPYELCPIHENRLTRYFGRLNNDEWMELQLAVEAYLRGESIESICTEQSVKEWKENNERHIHDDQREHFFPEDKSVKEENETTENKTPEAEKSDEPFEQEKVYPTFKGVGPRFEIPENPRVLTDICKSYINSRNPNMAVITEILGMPLSEAPRIAEMQRTDIIKTYGVCANAAGALRLLAKDYMYHGQKFSWKKDEEEKNPDVTPLPVMVTKPDDTELNHYVDRSEDNFGKQISDVQFVLSDQTMKYATDDIIKKILEIPTALIESNYIGKNFQLNYGNLMKRAGKQPNFHVVEWIR